jgi:hypothetical protein
MNIEVVSCCADGAELLLEEVAKADEGAAVDDEDEDEVEDEDEDKKEDEDEEDGEEDTVAVAALAALHVLHTVARCFRSSARSLRCSWSRRAAASTAIVSFRAQRRPDR